MQARSRVKASTVRRGDSVLRLTEFHRVVDIASVDDPFFPRGHFFRLFLDNGDSLVVTQTTDVTIST